MLHLELSEMKVEAVVVAFRPFLKKVYGWALPLGGVSPRRFVRPSLPVADEPVAFLAHEIHQRWRFQGAIFAISRCDFHPEIPFFLQAPLATRKWLANVIVRFGGLPT